MSIPMQNGGGIHNQTTPALAAKDAEIARLRAEVEGLAQSLTCAFEDDKKKAGQISELRAEVEGLREGLEAIYQFGSDTLRGPTGDTADDRQWHRTAVLEMTNRASRTVDTGSWKKNEGNAIGEEK